MGYINNQPWLDGSNNVPASGFLALMQLVNLALLVLWIWVIIDCARRSFRNGTEKALWIVALIFAPLIAGVAYLIVIKFNNPAGLLNPDFRGPSPAPMPRPVMPMPEPMPASAQPVQPVQPTAPPTTPPTPPTTPNEPPPRSF